MEFTQSQMSEIITQITSNENGFQEQQVQQANATSCHTFAFAIVLVYYFFYAFPIEQSVHLLKEY